MPGSRPKSAAITRIPTTSIGAILRERRWLDESGLTRDGVLELTAWLRDWPGFDEPGSRADRERLLNASLLRPKLGFDAPRVPVGLAPDAGVDSGGSESGQPLRLFRGGLAAADLELTYEQAPVADEREVRPALRVVGDWRAPAPPAACGPKVRDAPPEQARDLDDGEFELVLAHPLHRTRSPS